LLSQIFVTLWLGHIPELQLQIYIDSKTRFRITEYIISDFFTSV